jgi:hypothetical protein
MEQAYCPVLPNSLDWHYYGRSGVELHVPHFRIESIIFKQLVMGSFLGNHTILEDQDILALQMVPSRWAMTSTVRSLPKRSKASWTLLSVKRDWDQGV